jgi:hypothetical protein
MWFRPAFAAPYGVSIAPPLPGIDAWLEMLMMQPPVSWSFMTLYAFAAKIMGAVRLRSMMARMNRGDAVAMSAGG